MTKRWLALLLLVWSLPAAALELAGVKIAQQARVGADEPVLNGAGMRTRFAFKVYVGALHLPAKQTTEAQVLAQSGAKRVSLTLLRIRLGNQPVDEELKKAMLGGTA